MPPILQGKAKKFEPEFCSSSNALGNFNYLTIYPWHCNIKQWQPSSGVFPYATNVNGKVRWIGIHVGVHVEITSGKIGNANRGLPNCRLATEAVVIPIITSSCMTLIYTVATIIHYDLKS